ncbi:MAG TPA: 2-aminoethylphosphonate--pyruvate transaminase [Candidatus Acidoferrum sp.]|nr:2-aminoethylphosphonate--pyruvate transaminase [Candidatus Acidoferrum sp.]
MRREKLLFTPGPLSTSESVKRAMMRDLGSRDGEFIEVVRNIRRRLLQIGGVENRGYEAILMQGSGTFAIESVISSVIPRDGKLLVLINGAYGRRMAQIAKTLAIKTETVVVPESLPIDVCQAEAMLVRDPGITHVGVIHCETTTGMLNAVEALGKVVRRLGRVFVVDAMSSFGGMPLPVADWSIDFLISSANKCIQGVPGFGFVLARRDLLMESEGRTRSVSLDLISQWKGLEADGQFRFTPPTHALLAFWQALEELQAEGGVAGRAARYATNKRVLSEGMGKLGFESYLAPEHQSSIITSFRYPKHPNFNFSQFYERLSARGFVIYPGKVSDADCFRIGTIGHIFPKDIEALVAAIGETLREMGIAQLQSGSGTGQKQETRMTGASSSN